MNAYYTLQFDSRVIAKAHVQATPLSPDFQPRLLGTEIVFEEGDVPGMITDETPAEVYIESEFFTGWLSKAVFWDLSGVE